MVKCMFYGAEFNSLKPLHPKKYIYFYMDTFTKLVLYVLFIYLKKKET